MTDTNPSPKRSRRWITWIVGGAIGLVVLVYGAIFLYAKVLNDSPDELDSGDLASALTTPATSPGTASPSTEATTGTTAPAVVGGYDAIDPPTVPATTAAPASAPFDGSVDGAWTATTASQFGYRVDEVLAGVNTTAVGRSNEIDGTLTIAGTQVTAVDVSVEIASITSDSGQRDGQFRGRIMSADEFPTATFHLTEPIELGAIPAEGEQVTASATGELTLRGVTQPVTFDVTAQLTAGRIGVLGSIPVLFADYGIDNPSFGGVTTEDNGLVEFVLVFEQP